MKKEEEEEAEETEWYEVVVASTFVIEHLDPDRIIITTEVCNVYLKALPHRIQLTVDHLDAPLRTLWQDTQAAVAARRSNWRTRMRERGGRGGRSEGASDL